MFIKNIIISLHDASATCWCSCVYLFSGGFKMGYLSIKRSFFVILLTLIIVIALTTQGQNVVLAGKEVHSFQLPSVLKQGSDVRPREILFTAKYPGDIEVDVSWEPDGKKLNITLYDQDGKSLISKKDESPVHIVYKYTQEHFDKAEILGNVFRVGIAQSPFRTINGSVEIITPEEKEIEKDDGINTRGPYGTFIEEDDDNEQEKEDFKN
jgi:hypothetical protein